MEELVTCIKHRRDVDCGLREFKHAHTMLTQDDSYNVLHTHNTKEATSIQLHHGHLIDGSYLITSMINNQKGASN